jgi:general secretion pathway protein D
MARPRAARAACALLLPALALVLAPPAQAQEAPSDSATMRVEYAPNQPINAEQILAQWGKKFGALVITDPQIQPIPIRFLTAINTDLTWGAMKSIFDFHDIVIVESQPAPGGPYVIRAHHRRNINQKEGPPWRYVPGEQVPDFDELVTAVFQIKNGAGQSIFATVRGLLTRDTNRIGNILFVQGPEVLIIVDLASKVRYYARVIEALDVAGPRKEMEIYQVNFAPVQDLANVLTQVLNTLGGQQGVGAGGQAVVVAPGQGGAGGQAVVMADQRTNQLIVAAFPIDLPLVRRVIEELDVRVAAPTGRFHVYQCKDADAEDLAGKVQELFTGQQSTSRPRQSGSSGTSGTSATPAPAPSSGGTGAVSLGDGGGVGEVETRIVADERTNSLLIQAEERKYREILQVLEQLDKKRRRVLIEAEVWEVSTPNDSMTIGFELAALTNAADDKTRPVGATAYGLSQVNITNDANGNPIRLGRTPSLGTGLTAVLTRDTFDKLPVIMSAIANLSEARLVTKPFAVTNDNTPSTFTLSNRVPFLTTTVNNVASQQNVQFADANTTLTIEPQVNSEDNLTLKLTLEISSFTAQPTPNLPPPSNSRRYEGEVTVPNNRYVVFGGLESENESTSEQKVPFLGDIPILGHLFKNWTHTKSKTKVYIFIRPTIFSQTSFDAEMQVGAHLREHVHIASERDDWLPPVVPDRFLRETGYDLQDEAFDTFGSGSGDPFRAGAPVGLRPGATRPGAAREE